MNPDPQYCLQVIPALLNGTGTFNNFSACLRVVRYSGDKNACIVKIENAF